MIPAILAAPAVESLVGSVVGSVAGGLSSLFGSPSSSASTSSTTPSTAANPVLAARFNTLLTQAASRAQTAVLTAPIGTMTSTEVGQMSDTDLRTWMMGLTGKQVHAVDGQGHAVSGIVEGYSQTGGTIGLNINGHLLSISNLSQISWSPSVQRR